jgi:hypothetical protein
MYVFIYIHSYIGFISRLRYKRRINHLIRQKKIDTEAALKIQKFVRGEVYLHVYVQIYVML